MSRRYARRFAFEILFQLPFHSDFDYKFAISEYPLSESLPSQLELTPEDRVFVISELIGIFGQLPTIDEAISKLADKWRIDRLSSVDLAILRLAIYELFYTQIDVQVTINEAVDLAKRFSSDESPSFVNGVLREAMRLVSGKTPSGGQKANKTDAAVLRQISEDVFSSCILTRAKEK
jgi:N utilization substance protein B